MAAKRIVVLEGDETGQELLEEALRVLAPDVIGVQLDCPRFDLSLESRRATQNGVVHEAASALRESGLGLKAATITPEGANEVGSPNRILREEIGGRVIVRTGRRIPGVAPLGGVHAPISVVRMAVGDAYGAKEWREGEGDDEAAFRTGPSLQGKNVANPMAMILAGAALLGYGDEEAQRAGRAIRESALEAVADGIRTADLAGPATTNEYTDEVIRRTRQKLEVWSAL